MNDTTAEVRIDPGFLDWMQELSIGGEREALTARWKGLQALTEDFNLDLMETSIKLIFRIKPASTKAEVDAFKKHFIENDDLFERGDLTRELELLAGATLDVLLKDPDWTAEVGLALQTASCMGQRQTDLPVDLLGRCNQRLAEFAQQQRKRSKAQITVSKVSFEKAKKDIEATNDWATVAKGFASAADQANSVVSALARSAGNAITAIEKSAELMDEELQMLWWLIGAHSSTLHRPFSSVDEKSRIIVFAFELAGMTAVVPGPASITGLLQRAGVPSEQRCSIVTAINACDNDWLSAQLGDLQPSQAIAPLHYAIQRKLETGEDVAWVAVWTRVSALDAQAEFDATALALQFYRERVLLKHMESL